MFFPVLVLYIPASIHLHFTTPLKNTISKSGIPAVMAGLILAAITKSSNASRIAFITYPTPQLFPQNSTFLTRSNFLYLAYFYDDE